MKITKKTKSTNKVIKKKTGDKVVKSVSDNEKHNDRVKPIMEYLGISRFSAFPINYYKSTHEVYIIETEYLETYFLKIFKKNSETYKASIEKHFIVNVKNLAKFTPKINVAHDPENGLEQFLFTDRLAGGHKKFSDLSPEEKIEIVREVGQVLYKIHTYSSKRVLKEVVFGKVSDTRKTWLDFLKDEVTNKVAIMKRQGEEVSKILRFEKYCNTQFISISTHKIEPVVLHGSISLNEEGVLRSLLFLGTSLSAVLNMDGSIYGDRIWDLALFHDQVLSKNELLEKKFFGEYGKLRQEEKERLEFYKKILK